MIILGHLGAKLVPPCEHIGPPWDHLGKCWGLGLSWGHIEPHRGHLGALLGFDGPILVPFRGLGAMCPGFHASMGPLWGRIGAIL